MLTRLGAVKIPTSPKTREKWGTHSVQRRVGSSSDENVGVPSTANFDGIADRGFGIPFRMKRTHTGIFDETYRVVAVEEGSLTIRGVQSGETLTIVTPDAGSGFSIREYAPGQLIALSDPLNAPGN